MEQLETLFQQENLRLTEPRKDVFTILENSDTPLRIGEVVHQSQMAERTSVYRTLQLFVKLGIVDIVQVGFKQRYELAEPFKAHHHHLVCVQCGTLVDLHHTPKLEKLIERIAESHHFTLTAHHVELQGICTSCQKR